MLSGLDETFAGGGKQQREPEHQRDDGEAGDREADEGGVGASGRECLAGQAGQDRTGSTEPGEQVDEAEEGEGTKSSSPLERSLAPQGAV